MKVLLSGFFGAPNFGDELISYGMVRTLQKVGCEATVITHSRSTSERTLDGLNARFVEGWFPTRQFWSNRGAHWRAVLDCDAVIVGGGGLFSDRYSLRAIPRYLQPALLAAVMGKPFAVVGVGAVPIEKWWLKWLVRWTLPLGSFWAARDQSSREYLSKTSSPGLEWHISTDPGMVGLALRTEDQTLDGRALDRTHSRSEPSKAVLNLREYPTINPAAVLQVLDELLGSYGQVHLLSAEPPDERYYAGLLAKYAGTTAKGVKIIPAGSVSDTLTVIRNANLLVAERMHVIGAGLHLGIPSVPIVYEDKVTALLEFMGFRGFTASPEDLKPLIMFLRNRPPCPLLDERVRFAGRSAIQTGKIEFQRLLERVVRALQNHRPEWPGRIKAGGCLVWNGVSAGVGSLSPLAEATKPRRSGMSVT